MNWIEKRRSIYPKLFSKARVERTEVEALLKAARWAPTHKLTQPWRFQVFMDRGKEKLMTVQEALVAEGNEPGELRRRKWDRMRLKLEASGAVVAIVMKRDEEERVPLFEELCATACAVQNIYLMMQPLGLAGYWSTGGGTNTPLIRDFLGLAEKDMHLGWLFIGKSEVELPLPQNRMTVEEYVTWRV